MKIVAKNRMTIEELRALELPVTLECDDGYWNGGLKNPTVLYIGEYKVFIRGSDGTESVFIEDDLEHYPSQKPEPRTVVFRQWMCSDGTVYDNIVSNEGYYLTGQMSIYFKDNFLKWVGEEHHIEVPSDWRGEGG